MSVFGLLNDVGRTPIACVEAGDGPGGSLGDSSAIEAIGADGESADDSSVQAVCELGDCLIDARTTFAVSEMEDLRHSSAVVPVNAGICQRCDSLYPPFSGVGKSIYQDDRIAVPEDVGRAWVRSGAIGRHYYSPVLVYSTGND